MPTQDFLGAQLVLARAESPPTAEAEAYQRAYESRFAERSTALVGRLEAEPAVAVTFSSAGLGGESLRIEVDAGEPRSDVAAPDAVGPEGHSVLINQVDADFFDVFGVPLLAGRGFEGADTREGSTSVIINRMFAERVLGGGNVLGRLIRPVSRGDADPGAVEDRWFEIVGVVPDFPNPMPFGDVVPRLYQPVAPGDIHPSTFISGSTTDLWRVLPHDYGTSRPRSIPSSNSTGCGARPNWTGNCSASCERCRRRSWLRP